MNAEQPIPRWQKLLAIAYVLVAALLVVVFWGRIPGDFWPPDKSSVGPNIVAAVVTVIVVTPVGVLLWPPTRRRIHRFVDRKIAPLHAHVAALHERHDDHAQSLADLHRKLDALTNDKESQ